MPRTNRISALDSSIAAVVARAKDEIANAVRAFIAAEVYRLVGAMAPAMPMAAPKRGPGRPPNLAAAAAPVAKGKRARSDRSYSDADIARTLDVIESKPGLLPSQYRAAANVGKRPWGNLIDKLKAEGKIKVTGKGLSTSYVVVSSGAPAPVAPATKGEASVQASSGGRRTSDQVLADVEKLLAFVKANPGKHSEEIQKALKMPKSIVAPGLLALREAGRIKLTGVKRAATYSVV